MAAQLPVFGAGDFRDLPEWQAATRFASLVELVGRELTLPAELEWLRYLLLRSGAAVPPLIEGAWGRPHLAEYLLGLYESLDHVLLLEYYVLFLRDEVLLTPERADELDARRADLQQVILDRSAALRDVWRTEYRQPSGAPFSVETAALAAIDRPEP